jgi:hypothetical protein
VRGRGRPGGVGRGKGDGGKYYMSLQRQFDNPSRWCGSHLSAIGRRNPCQRDRKEESVSASSSPSSGHGKLSADRGR